MHFPLISQILNITKYVYSVFWQLKITTLDFNPCLTKLIFCNTSKPGGGVGVVATLSIDFRQRTPYELYFIYPYISKWVQRDEALRSYVVRKHGRPKILRFSWKIGENSKFRNIGITPSPTLIKMTKKVVNEISYMPWFTFFSVLEWQRKKKP